MNESFASGFEPSFLPTIAAAQARIAAVRPAAYARTRNTLGGAVSQLSPYITHGFVTLADLLAGVAKRHALDVQHKFVYELGWRAYFRHVWQYRGDGILQSLHEGPLPDASATSSALLEDGEARCPQQRRDANVTTASRFPRVRGRLRRLEQPLLRDDHDREPDADSHAAHNIKGCPFHGYGSSRNMAVDQHQTSKGGTVCYMEYANTQVLSSGGAITWPHIVLAHELIHSYHCLYGIHADAQEENKTSGIGDYANEPMSENGFRKAFNLPPRVTYG